MSGREIAAFFRWPKLPVVVLVRDTMKGAVNQRQLIGILEEINEPGSVRDVKVVDSSGMEFWFVAESRVLAPAIIQGKWSKKRLIEHYNQTCSSGEPAYQAGSLSNRRLAQIVEDLASLLANRASRRMPPAE